MNIKIAGISLYYIISWFFIYSFLGWVWESAYVSVKTKKLVNRGFINGPFCTIYGAGAVSVYLILKPFDENLLVLYTGGVLVATLLEYITGWLMEKIFHTRWWDYSQKRWNLQGYICVGSSIAWGFFTVLLFKVFHPFVSWITSLYSQYVGNIMIAVLTVLYGIDFVTSAKAAFELSKAFEKAEDMLEDIVLYIQSSRLYESAEEIREKLEVSGPYLRMQEAVEHMAGKKQEFMERFEMLTEERHLWDAESYGAKKAELEQRLDEFVKKYLDIRRKHNVVKKRMVHAYPELKKHFRQYREKHQEKRTH